MERRMTSTPSPLPRTPSFRLDGRRALVTGASRGIGLGAAVALAEAGAHVTAVARTEGPLMDAVDAMRAEGWSIEPLVMDVAEIGVVADRIAETGPYDILINNAGLARHSPLTETEPADFDDVMDVNVRAAYFMAQAVAKGLIAAGKPGSIINISSQMGHVGGVDRAVYCATKFAVEGFTKAMAIELGPRQIRVNTICPTFIRTPLAEATLKIPERRAWVESKIKLGPVGEIQDIMGAVVFLASDAAGLITGTSLLVDGGWTAD
jgi:NAD(P)-dependent dehydrogenase (short-subunit alcohol dehydrogenase family)